VLIPAGYQNRYGHPHADILDRYRRQGSEIFTSYKEGEITVNFAPGLPPKLVERYRPEHARYWHTRLDAGLRAGRAPLPNRLSCATIQD
jgi:competence protein ComEC